MSEELTKTKLLPIQGKDMDSIMQNLETGVAELFWSLVRKRKALYVIIYRAILIFFYPLHRAFPFCKIHFTE